MRTVFSGGGVIVDADSELASGFVVVDDGVITGVGEGDAPIEYRQAADRVVDTTGLAVMPG
ncbi:MAG: 5-methylthioadenosine/S-adenosylhomocysteine deaminase, partial [Mycobacterium sp.]|nr:5-methylthioadenosine/S-adenosylhomocysteine deaminase [Mycobacterium sp.]